MSEWKRETKRKLFGLHPGKTAEYIRKLKQYQQQSLLELRNQVEAQEKSNAALKREAEALEAELADRRRTDALYQTAQDRLAASKKALRALGEAEAKSIGDRMKAEEERHWKRMERIEAQSRRYEETFRSLLEELTELVGKVERLDRGLDLIEDQGAEQPVEETAGVSFYEVAASKVLEEREADRAPVFEENTDEAPTPTEIHEEELESLHRHAKVIQFKLRKIVEERKTDGEGLEAGEKEAEADRRKSAAKEEDRREAQTKTEPAVEALELERREAEGVAEKRETENARASREDYREDMELAAASSWGASSPVAPSSKRSSARKNEMRRAPRSPSKPSAFWGDINEYLDDFGDTAVEADGGLEENIDGGGFERKSDFFDLPSSPVEAPSRKSEASSRSSTPPDRVVAAPPRGASTGEEQGRESPALTEEILSIRNRYIVGKLAGETLHGYDGRVIVNKNQRITPAIVQEADKEGKLPDLIIHMIVPIEGGEV
ncbi:hypothetical protein FE782_11775 [Paenibacillus antri]|uniref:Uncharacterized protein n=1 Tax=Paenibacillus antri TaxID=2582848 RepID=A0A5R9GH15_9BACL|nr:hypothetical protein [Paenibacillus antri]TLS52043.1 hypothetical protein FE782_11775 [Paenibacillus antri]